MNVDHLQALRNEAQARFAALEPERCALAALIAGLDAALRHYRDAPAVSHAVVTASVALEPPPQAQDVLEDVPPTPAPVKHSNIPALVSAPESITDAVIAILAAERTSMSANQLERAVEKRLGGRPGNVYSALGATVKSGQLKKTGMFYSLPDSAPILTEIPYTLPEKWVEPAYRDWRIDPTTRTLADFRLWARQTAARLGRAPSIGDYEDEFGRIAA